MSNLDRARQNRRALKRKRNDELAFGACILAAAIAPHALAAQPTFLDRAQELPFQHDYDGGWEHFVGGGVALFDCNGDDFLDLFAAGGSNPASLFVNSSERGGPISYSLADAPPLVGATGAYPIDINGDDLLDLFVLRNGPNAVLLGRGDCSFDDATDALGIRPGNAWTTAFAATWEPDQDRPTLAIGNYVDASDPNGPFGTCDTNWLLRPDGERYAEPIALEPGYCPLSMLISDWRRDGEPLLRISNDRQYYVRDGYEQMWSLDPLREWPTDDGWDKMQLWGMGIASADLTGDGKPEVMLTSMGDQMLMTNTGQGFAVVPFTTGTFAQRPHTGDDGRPSTGWHAEFGDIDNDGLADLFIAKGNVDQMPTMAIHDPNNLLMQQPDGTFIERASEAGVATTERSRGGGLVDLNNDGLLDIVVVNRRAPLEVWQNATIDAGNWLHVNLRQATGNTRAIGAIIELRTGTGLQTRELTIGGGHASGSLGPIHFGLADAEQAELRVVWPDGVATDWNIVEANQTVTIMREAGAN
ncbi:CRTAC1 family protein [Flavimaricola marinus]|uniref:ASPIC and UnbV n=1 Tax=Flavimaricola marinus TaxID=1819565 RepID=A0A238LKU1_9RHOB|nr:CRTAC1 family protein [Flavimaricola marinus]SMY10291.1 ASPIC and UnbV [Flavimaricola marinus]